jgi:hypothetical protein
MHRLRFKPVMEELAARVLPDEVPPTATVVGPFALGMYPQDPPPAGTSHSHEWLEDAYQRTVRILARAAGNLDEAEGDYFQLQQGNADMQNALRDRVRGILSWAQDLDAQEQRQTQQAQARYDRAVRQRDHDHAAEANMDIAYHAEAGALAGQLRTRLANLLNATGNDFVPAVNAELQRAVQEAERTTQAAETYRRQWELRQVPQREFRLRAGRAQVACDYARRLAQAVQAIRQQFGQ